MTLSSVLRGLSLVVGVLGIATPALIIYASDKSRWFDDDRRPGRWIDDLRGQLYLGFMLLVQAGLALVSIVCLGWILLRPANRHLWLVALAGLLPLAVNHGVVTVVVGPGGEYRPGYLALAFLIPIAATTTGALAQAILIYAEAHRSTRLSPLWYVLLVASLPLVGLPLYGPSSTIQLAIFVVLQLYLALSQTHAPDLRRAAWVFLAGAAFGVALDYVPPVGFIASLLLGACGLTLGRLHEFTKAVAVWFLLRHFRLKAQHEHDHIRVD